MFFFLLSFRQSYEEKVLIVSKYREGHKCDYRWQVISIIKWEGIKTDTGKKIYETMRKNLGAHGISSTRGCSTNKDKSCTCNEGSENGGGSFTFGCSKHKFYQCCKFGRSVNFQLTFQSHSLD